MYNISHTFPCPACQRPCPIGVLICPFCKNIVASTNQPTPQLDQWQQQVFTETPTLAIPSTPNDKLAIKLLTGNLLEIWGYDSTTKMAFRLTDFDIDSLLAVEQKEIFKKASDGSIVSIRIKVEGSVGYFWLGWVGGPLLATGD